MLHSFEILLHEELKQTSKLLHYFTLMLASSVGKFHFGILLDLELCSNKVES